MLHIFSVRDKVSGSFMNPFFAPHAAVAIRSMADVASDKSTVLAKHPQDFALYRIGTFEPDSGIIYPEVVPVFIQDIDALLRRVPEEVNNEKSQ